MREMTGTELINRRANDFSYHLANAKLAKSRSNLELPGHGRVEQMNHDRHGQGGQRSTDKTRNSTLTTSRRNSRIGQRDSLTKARSKSKEMLNVAENSDPNKVSASSSLLPPISGHQITNSHAKNGGLSPRYEDASAPTRLAMRSTASPDNMTGKPPETSHSHSGVDKTSPPATANTGRNGSAANNLSTWGRSAQLASPESPRFPESSRLSPINSHDKPKVKFEKKVNKLQAEESMPSSPRAYKISSAENGGQQQPPPSRDSKTKRRPSIKSLPKIAHSEEPFSVRRKIEQFRKWHEEHYADTLKTSGLKEEAPEAATAEYQTKAPEDVDFAKILEHNIIQNRLPETGGEKGETPHSNSKPDMNGNVFKPKNSPSREEKAKARPVSGATWKTWRDVNQSDAYDDVNKYIKDNDLMDEQRQKWIQTWIYDVRTAMAESEEVCMDEG